MIETVVVLLMFVGAEIKEHRIQPSMSECLKGKRHASRNISENIEFKCIKSKAKLETNIDGSKSIKSLILNP
tara:strand:+ start:165 stop:380 length:216 start_codon:yes stop_codon:yes gene_type:complete